LSELEWLELESPEQIMDGAIAKYELEEVYVLLSGGQDSIAIADYITTNHPDLFAGVLFTCTGLAVQRTRKFVVEYCKKRNWKLYFTWPKEKERVYNIVMKHGFAGAGNHRMWMGFLKYHTWYQFMMWRLSFGKKCAFISGVRKKESWARDKLKLYSKKPVDTDGKLIFIKPFLYKNGSQMYQYFIENDLRKSPVYSWLDMSGECECGAHAEPWELKMLEKNDPLTFESIQWLEEQIELHGNKKAKKYSKWGMGPSTMDVTNQTTFEDFVVNEDYCGESCEV